MTRRTKSNRSFKKRIKIAAIVPAAGSGTRMKAKQEKPFIKLSNRELIAYSLKVLDESPVIDEIVIATKQKNIQRLERLTKKEQFEKIRSIVEGGKTRAASVYNGLCSVSEDVDLVVIHDCARPFINKDIIKKTVSEAKRHGAALAAVLVKPTIKRSDKDNKFVKETIDRKALWEAQTPQAFKKETLLKGYAKIKTSKANFTDDVSIVEAIGQRAKIVPSSYSNIKITTEDDLSIAEAIIKKGLS